MKLLYLPLLVKNSACEQYDLLNAFRNVIPNPNFNIKYFDYNNFHGNCDERLIEIFKDFMPDVVHMQIQETRKISPQAIRFCREIKPDCIFTQWCGDVRYDPVEAVIEIGRFCDYSLFSNEGQLGQYEAAIGRPCRYWQNAVAPRFYGRRIPRERRWGIVFIGNNYQKHFEKTKPNREEFVTALYKHFGRRFRLYGNNWGDMALGIVPWSKQNDIYQTAVVTVSHNNIVTDRYFSDRTLIMMAAGGVPHVFHYSKGVEKDFEDGVDVLYWRTIDEAIAKIEWVFSNWREAEQIGRSGFMKIQRFHNWAVRVKEYQQIVGVELAKDNSQLADVIVYGSGEVAEQDKGKNRMTPQIASKYYRRRPQPSR